MNTSTSSITIEINRNIEQNNNNTETVCSYFSGKMKNIHKLCTKNFKYGACLLTSGLAGVLVGGAADPNMQKLNI